VQSVKNICIKRGISGSIIKDINAKFICVKSVLKNIMTKNHTSADLTLLKPKVRKLAEELMKECEKQGFSVIISRGFRSEEEQDEFYAQGRTKQGEIITMVKAGFSFHNFGVAFDIRPIVGEDEGQKKKTLYQKAGEIGMALGLEWGGTWTDFLDVPHFQHTAGYSIEDFRNNAVDWNKFHI